MSVTYTAVLDVSEDSAGFLSALLHAERARRGTRKGTRALGTYQQAVLVLRWFLDDARMSGLARDNGIGLSTAYDYRDEGIAVPAARRPSLHGALLAARAAGYSHVIVDGTLIYTDRVATPGPTSGVDLWWSGKHHHHGGNIQVLSAPDGWPLWTSGVRPGREHDTTAARADPELLARLADWVGDGRLSLADLGYEGEPEIFRIPVKKPQGGELTVDQQSYNALHGALRCLGERANSLLKTTYKALRRYRRYRGCPWRLGAVVAAALVLLHHDNHRTT
ncbi:MAG: HARBI1 family protein [Pseudonocardiaceae bacterium]